MGTQEASLESCTISALLSYSQTTRHSNILEVLPKFSTPLKTNFEDRNLWLRFGLTLSLTHESPRSAIEAFNECLRIDQQDPLPAMLAAKLLLQKLNDPNEGLKFANEAIERCQKYKKNTPMLSKCYLLASIMHAHIYEREPESIKRFKASNHEASLHFLDLASKTYSDDYLIYFHRALHDARQKAYHTAIDNIRQAIKLNPHHVPSMQLLILSLSALKLYDEALIICESALHEFKDDLLLLYIKCNLEQCLVETKGYKSALSTAQHILKCMRRSTSQPDDSGPDQAAETKQATNLFADEKHYTNGHEFLAGELPVWLLVAEIFIKIGSIKDAELCVDEGSAHVNGALSHQIMFIRGLIAKAKNSLGEAKSFFQSCLALCPKHANALQQIAHVHHLLGNQSTAEKFLRDSLDVDSENHKTWHYMSLVYIETNQHDKASECVKKAATLEESSPVVSISAISRLILE